LKTFPLTIGNMQACPHSPLLFNIVLEVLASAIKLREEINSIQFWKEEIKLSLFSDDMILCVENSQNYQKAKPELISELGKVTYTRSIHKNQSRFSILTMNTWKQKFKNQYHLQLLQRNKLNKTYIGSMWWKLQNAPERKQRRPK